MSISFDCTAIADTLQNTKHNKTIITVLGTCEASRFDSNCSRRFDSWFDSNENFWFAVWYSGYITHSYIITLYTWIEYTCRSPSTVMQHIQVSSHGPRSFTVAGQRVWNVLLVHVWKLPFPSVSTYFNLKSWITGMSTTQCLIWLQFVNTLSVSEEWWQSLK